VRGVAGFGSGTSHLEGGEVDIQNPVAFWQQIAAHTFAARRASSPWSFQTAVAGLVGDHDIVGSTVHYDPDGPTVWSVVIVTDDDRIVKAHASYDETDFDNNLEATLGAQSKVPPQWVDSWSRRLRDSVRLDVWGSTIRLNSFNQPIPDQLDYGRVVLHFNDGGSVVLVSEQRPAYEDDCDFTDALLQHVRQVTGL
jgi:hypothetical protein